MMHNNALNAEPRIDHNGHEIHELNKAHDVNEDHHAVVHQGHREHGAVPVTVRNTRDDHDDERHHGLDRHPDTQHGEAQQQEPVLRGDAPEKKCPNHQDKTRNKIQVEETFS